MKKAYCCHVLDSSLSSSQKPCDFGNKSNCLFPQEHKECYICKVGERHRRFLFPCPQSAQWWGWDGFACSCGRGEWSKPWISSIILCLQLTWGLCKTAGGSLKPSQCFLLCAGRGWLAQGKPSSSHSPRPCWCTGQLLLPDNVVAIPLLLVKSGVFWCFLSEWAHVSAFCIFSSAVGLKDVIGFEEAKSGDP